MAYPKWFNEVEYLNNKLAHLQKIGAKDANGSDFTSISQVADALKAAGTDPYSHYNAYGSAEGLSPSVAFDAIEYCQFKLRQLQEDPATKSEWASKNWEDVQYGINKAGMSLGQHYAQYGAVEGVSMSNGFDGNAYLTAKLALLKAADKTYETWSVKQLAEAMKGMGLDPYTHYMTFKGGEGEVGPNATFYPEKPVGGGGSKVSTLTTDADTLSGNVFNAPSVVTMVGAQVDSLQSVDTLTGIGANPTLNVTLADNIVATPVLKGIETINIKGEANAVGLDLSQASGLKTLNADLSRTSLTIEDVQNNITVGVSKAAASAAVVATNDLLVQFADSVVAGAEDVAKVVLTANGNVNVAGNQRVNLTATSTGGFETLEITANGANRIGSVLSDTAAGLGAVATATNSVRTIKVSGEGSLRMDDALTSTTTFDASANKGGVNVTLNNAGNITVTGGEGNDTFNLAGTLTNGDKIDGGAGRDTLIVSAATAAGLGVGNQVSNVEILNVGGAGNFTFDNDNMTSIDAIVHDSTAAMVYQDMVGANAADATKGLTILGIGAATYNIKGATGLGGSSDALYVKVGDASGTTGVNVATGGNASLTTVGTEKVTIEVVAHNTADNTANQVTLTGDASTSSVVIKGGAVATAYTQVIAGATGVALTSIDGSEFVGNLTVAGNAFAQTITGGHGDDNISTGGRGLATTNGDVLTGGAGNDTFIFAAADSTAVLPNAAIAGSFTDVQKALFTQITDLNLGGANAATGVDKVNLATVLAVTQANLSVVNGGAATAMTGATFGGAVDALINGGVLDTGGANAGDSARVGLFTWGGETFLIANEAATAATQYTQNDTIVLLVTGVTGTLDASDIVAA